MVLAMVGIAVAAEVSVMVVSSAYAAAIVGSIHGDRQHTTAWQLAGLSRDDSCLFFDVSLVQVSLADVRPTGVDELEAWKRKVSEGFVSTSTRW